MKTWFQNRRMKWKKDAKQTKQAESSDGQTRNEAETSNEDKKRIGEASCVMDSEEVEIKRESEQSLVEVLVH